MERAWNSDSETHVEKLNWTSSTDLSRKSLSCIFFGTPCSKRLVNSIFLMINHSKGTSQYDKLGFSLNNTVSWVQHYKIHKICLSEKSLNFSHVFNKLGSRSGLWVFSDPDCTFSKSVYFRVFQPRSGRSRRQKNCEKCTFCRVQHRRNLF